MSEYLTVLLYVSVWMILYHLFIIPRTAQQAFEVWQQRLEDERNLIVDITEPVIEVIELNPSSKMVDAVKSGDLYNVLGEYISNKAGLGDISDIIKTQIKPEEGQNETKWKF